MRTPRILSLRPWWVTKSETMSDALTITGTPPPWAVSLCTSLFSLQVCSVMCSSPRGRRLVCVSEQGSLGAVCCVALAWLPGCGLCVWWGGWSRCGSAMRGPCVYRGVCIRVLPACPRPGSGEALGDLFASSIIFAEHLLCAGCFF